MRRSRRSRRRTRRSSSARARQPRPRGVRLSGRRLAEAVERRRPARVLSIRTLALEPHEALESSHGSAEARRERPGPRRRTSPDAGRVRVRAHSRRRSISSRIVIASGSVSAIAPSGAPARAPRRRRTRGRAPPPPPARSRRPRSSRTAAPARPGRTPAGSRSRRAGGCRRSRGARRRWAGRRRRSRRSGPCAAARAAARSMRLAVAITNTGAVFSCSQVRKVPNTRAVTPPSVVARRVRCPRGPSRSRRSRARRARRSRPCLMAVRMFSSDEPTRPPKIRPMSRRSSGRPQCAATALAVRLLPQPCTPSSRMPLGSGRPKRARLVAERRAAPREPALEVVEAADVAPGPRRRW